MYSPATVNASQRKSAVCELCPARELSTEKVQESEGVGASVRAAAVWHSEELLRSALSLLFVLRWLSAALIPRNSLQVFSGLREHWRVAAARAERRLQATVVIDASDSEPEPDDDYDPGPPPV